jgi:hypothetical protein
MADDQTCCPGQPDPFATSESTGVPMNWRSLLRPALVQRPQGLFLPGNFALDMALYLGAAVLVAGWSGWRFYTGAAGFSQMFFVQVIALLVMAAVRVVRRLQHGALGPPLVQVADGVLTLALPMNLGRSQLQVPLAELQQITVYGPPGARRFKLAYADGRIERVRPVFGRRLEGSIIEFLRQHLPPSSLAVAAPPTLFGDIRGDSTF